MNHLVEQQPKSRLPSVRRALVRIHRDLFTIHGAADMSAAYFPREITPLESMVMILEDRRFMRHAGIDFRASLREMIKLACLRKHGGASTIDMQFVRTATGYRDRTIFRKLYECFLSCLIQYRYSKIVILRSYLSCAFFGSKLKGANAAAQKIYGLPADDLTLDQAAFLAAMLVYPRPISPSVGWEKKVSRRASYGMRIYARNKERFDKLISGKSG